MIEAPFKRREKCDVCGMVFATDAKDRNWGFIDFSIYNEGEKDRAEFIITCPWCTRDLLRRVRRYCS